MRWVDALLLIAGCAAGACSKLRAGPDEIDALLLRGDSAYADARFAAARTLWRSALPAVTRTGDKVREARLLTSIGLAAWRLGEYSEARSVGESALTLKLDAGLKPDLFKSYNALGLLANDEGRLDDALALYESAARAARAAGDNVSLAKSANNIALVQVARGQWVQARAGYLEAIRVGRLAGEALIEGRAQNNLAALDIQLGDPGSALEAVRSALLLLRSIGDRAGEQNALGQLGTAYDMLGEPRRALAAFDSALQLSREQGLQQEEASNLELLAGVYRQAGDLQRALDQFDAANRLNLKLGLLIEQGANRRNSAEIHATMGRTDLARADGLSALALHRTAGVPLEELRDLLLLAELASRDSRGTEAAAYLKAAEGLSLRLDARIARVELALARAMLADRTGHPREVITTLRAARSDLDRGGFGNEWQAAALRARAYAQLNRLDSAALAGQEAVAAVERVRSGFGSSMLRGAYAGEKQQVYSELVQILLRQARTAEALEIADAARSRALLEHLAASGRDSGGAGSTVGTLAESERLLRQIDSVVSRLDALDGVSPAARDAASREQTRVLVAQLVESRSAYEALLVRLAERDAAGMALLGGRRLDVRQLQGALRPGEAMLEYLATPNGLTTFIATREAVHSIATDLSREDLARRVRLARDLLDDPLNAAERSRQVLRGLYAALIAPAERTGWLAGTTRLIIVPHSVLAYLPFAALQDERSGHYLMERYTLLHLPLAAGLHVLRGAHGDTPARSRSGQATAFAPFPGTLPGSLREVRALQAGLGGGEAREGKRATEQRVRQALSGGGIVHLATHGLLNSRNPMFSRVDLSAGRGNPQDDGRLEVHELLALRTDASLVFLSGCETGVGAAWSTQFARGEDYATLAQAFLFSGAGNVVGTLWSIQDEGAAAFAGRFYAALGGQPPAEALATAQRQMLKDERFKSPYHWAAYQVFGSNDLEPPPHRAVAMSVSPN